MAKIELRAKSSAHGITDEFAKSAHEAVDVVAEKVRPAEETLRVVGSTAKENYRSGKERVLEKSSEVTESVRHYVGDNPLMALGMAFASGLIISVLMRK